MDVDVDAGLRTEIAEFGRKLAAIEATITERVSRETAVATRALESQVAQLNGELKIAFERLARRDAIIETARDLFSSGDACV
jgi:hypothetical protein